MVPNVATSWDINASNTVFTFHLRPKSRFSSGEYVTAQSFVRGFTRALTPDIYHAAGSPPAWDSPMLARAAAGLPVAASAL